MRTAHAIEAEWHPDGSLSRVVLGPEETEEPVAVTGLGQESEEQKQARTVAERRTRFGAVSGLRRRDDP